MKKIPLLLILTFLCLFPTKQTLASFSDVSPNNLHAEDINELSELGLIKGYENGNFGPNDSIIRQNVARILGRWLQLEHYYIPEDALSTKRFYDISLTDDTELVKLTALLAEEGIFNGSEGRLMGTANMSREQTALVLVRSVKTVYDEDLVEAYKQANFKSNVKDIHNLSVEAQEAIIALEYKGITKNEFFAPSSNLTRAQFSSFINRILKLYKPQSEDILDAALEQVESEPDEAAIVVETEQLPNSHFVVKKGASLFGSQNGKRIIAQMQIEQTFPIVSLENEEMLFFEVGLERFYVFIKDVALIQEQTEEVHLESLGFIRVNPQFTLYADEALTIPLLTGNYAARFKVIELNDSVYAIHAGSQKAYIGSEQRVLFKAVPYKLLSESELLKTSQENRVIGSIGKGTVILGDTTNARYMHWTDGSDRYAVLKNEVIEVDELTPSQAIVNKLNQVVTVKSQQSLYTSNGVYVGKINKGEPLRIRGTNGANGLTTYAGISVQLPLTSIFHTNLIDGSQPVKYTKMVEQLKIINRIYPSFTELIVIGKTVEGRDIYALKVGTGKREIIMDASLHAREYMTSSVLMEMIDDYTNSYARNSTYEGYNVRELLDKTSIWFVPMVNIDGVNLVQNGVASTSLQSSVIKINGSKNVARWKANIRGVDLNRNFDGGWNALVSGVSGPAWRNYKGGSVFSEPESRALRDFVRKHNFQAYISYHSSGNILYYSHGQTGVQQTRDYQFAQKIKNVTGYAIMPGQHRKGSGSSADWFIQTYKKPGITMEISPYVGDKPVPLNNWADVWKRNKTIGLLSVKASEAF